MFLSQFQTFRFNSFSISQKNEPTPSPGERDAIMHYVPVPITELSQGQTINFAEIL